MNEVGELLPVAAWIQAVFVCLFFLFVAYMLAWNSRQGKDSRDFQKAESDSNREFQRDESNKWQKFIADLNENWRQQSNEQREDQNCAMADVNKSLTNLTKTTGDLARSVEEMRSDLRDHDNQAKEILHQVQINGKPQPKPRVKTAGIVPVKFDE